MLNLPPVPKVFNTHHLTCVACKEKFVVSEGTEHKRQEIPLATSSVNVRFEDNRQKLQVVPTPHAAHYPTSKLPASGDVFDYQVVNCPRCGADNRNWLYLNHYPKRPILNSLFIGSLEVRLNQMRGIMLLVVVVLALAMVMGFIAYFDMLPTAHSLILAFIAPLVVYVIFEDFTQNWQQFREDEFLFEHKLKRRNPSWGLRLRGLFFVFFFSFIVPVFSVSLLPRGFYFVSDIIQEAPEESVSQTIHNIGELTDQRLEEARINLQAVTQDMQSLLSRMSSNTSPQLEKELDAFSNELDAIVTDATKVLEESASDGTEFLEAQREDEIATIASARETAVTNFREEFLVELRLLVIWGTLLGGVTLVTVYIAIINLTKFIARINAHLPLPIFHSVAGMTRLVTWEAKKALEIEGNLQHIQWMSVNRNETGGISLMGLHRDPPTFDTFGRAQGETVRAQRYLVKSDMWGRIIDVKIEDTAVRRPAGGPDLASALPVPHDAPVAVRPPAR